MQKSAKTCRSILSDQRLPFPSDSLEVGRDENGAVQRREAVLLDGAAGYRTGNAAKKRPPGSQAAEDGGWGEDSWCHREWARARAPESARESTQAGVEKARSRRGQCGKFGVFKRFVGL